MSKIDIDKFVASLIEFSPQQSMKYIKALADQGLKYKDEEIVEIPQESEDEKIRKYFIAKFKKMLEEDNLQPLGTVDASKLLAWLEQQRKNEVEKGGELRKWLDFVKTHEGTTITIPKDLKGTDTDGGVVGEKGEQGEQPTNKNFKERYENIAKSDWFKKTHKDISIGEEQPTEEDSLGTKAIKEQIENLKKRIEDNQLGCIVQRLDKIIELLQSAILILPQETYIPPIICKRPLDPDPNTLGGWETTANIFGSDYDIDTDKIKQNETSKPES